MNSPERLLLSGNKAVALAARNLGIALGTGYPGTPSTEILEEFSELGGHAQWAPNEKVALEVGLGAAYGGARALVTMKHVGLNVAADPLFTAAYTGGCPYEKNRLPESAGAPDSQEAYDFLAEAVHLSERWKLPVLLRMTTRVCHALTPVEPHALLGPASPPHFEYDVAGRVMIPAYARPAHKRLRVKLAEIAA